MTCGMGEKFSSTELSVSIVDDGTGVETGVGATSTVDRTSVTVSISLTDDSVVVAIVLVDGTVVVNGISVVTGGNAIVGVGGDSDVDIVVDGSAFDGITVVCSTEGACNIIGAGIITCTIDGDGCITLLGMIGICAFIMGSSGIGGVRKICEL